MALSTGRMKLYNSLKTLRVHWDQVRDVWNDPVSLDFEETYWKPLGAQVDITLRETDRLGQVLDKLHRDCS
jgi:hypothetical protein